MTIPYMFNENNSLAKTLTDAICKLNNITLPELNIEFIKEDDNYVYFKASLLEPSPIYDGSFNFKVAKDNKGSTSVIVHPNFDRNEENSFMKYKINDLISNDSYRNGEIDHVKVLPIVAYTRPGNNKVKSNIKERVYAFGVSFIAPFIDNMITSVFNSLINIRANGTSISCKFPKDRVVNVDYFELETKNYEINEYGCMWKITQYGSYSAVKLTEEPNLKGILMNHFVTASGDKALENEQYYNHAVIVGGVEVEKNKFSAIDVFFQDKATSGKLYFGVITLYAKNQSTDKEPPFINYQIGVDSDGRYDIAKVFGSWVTRAYSPMIYKLITRLLGDYKLKKAHPRVRGNGIEANSTYWYPYDFIPTTSSLYHPSPANDRFKELGYPDICDRYYQLVPIYLCFRLKWHFGTTALYLPISEGIDKTNLREYIKNKYNVLLFTEEDGLEVETMIESPRVKQYQLIAKSGLAMVVHGYGDSIMIFVS